MGCVYRPESVKTKRDVCCVPPLKIQTCRQVESAGAGSITWVQVAEIDKLAAGGRSGGICVVVWFGFTSLPDEPDVISDGFYFFQCA